MQKKNYDSRSGVVRRGHQRMERRDDTGTTGNFGGDDIFTLLIVVMVSWIHMYVKIITLHTAHRHS